MSRELGDLFDSETGELLILGAVALVFGPRIIRGVADQLTQTVAGIKANPLNGIMTAAQQFNRLQNPQPNRADLVRDLEIDDDGVYK